MRVVAGIARGRRLVAPKGDATRPTSDFVREAVFNTLAGHTDLEGAAVLDLFAGTGALGLEALSRGAASAAFVESDRRAVAAIRANIAALGLDGASVHQAEVLRWLARPDAVPAAEFDVVFADPPYVWDGWAELFGRLPPALAVLESNRPIDVPDGWQLLKVKHYGDSVVTLTCQRSDS